jgi:hypothetical protein
MRKIRPGYFLLIAVPVIMGLAESCVNHDLGPSITVDCTGVTTVSYLNDIKPIVDANCSRCHNSTFAGKNWTDPAQLKSRADEARRRVLLPVTHGDHMPQDPPELTFEEIQSIVCWAEQGAPINN